LRWLGGRVPGPDGAEPNRLSAISRWEDLDNLRRSVVEIAQLTLLVAGWLFLPGDAGRVDGAGVGGDRVAMGLLDRAGLVRLPGDKSWRAYYRSIGRDAVTSAQQFHASSVVFLPHQGWCRRTRSSGRSGGCS